MVGVLSFIVAGGVVSGSIERITFAKAYFFSDGGFVVIWIMVEMQIDGLVATLGSNSVKLVGSRIGVWGAVPSVNRIGANGFIFMFFDDIVHRDGYAGILRSLSIADVASVSGGLCGRSYGIGDIWIAEASGRCPRIGDVACASACTYVDLPATALANADVGAGIDCHGATADMDGHLVAAGALSLRVTDRQCVGLVGSEGHGLCVLRIGVDNHVGGRPLVVELAGAAAAAELGRAAIGDGLVGTCVGNGRCIDGDGLGLGAGAMAVATSYCESHLIVAGIGIGMGRVLL